MLMCSCVMQEEGVSAGMPICGWHGLAEGKQGKGLGERRYKGGLMLLNCVQEAAILKAPGIIAGKKKKRALH